MELKAKNLESFMLTQMKKVIRIKELELYPQLLEKYSFMDFFIE